MNLFPRVGRVSLGQKLTLVVGLLSLLALVLVVLLTREQGIAIEFSSKEIRGNQYHQELRPLWRALHEASLLEEKSPASQRKTVGDALTKGLSGLYDGETKHGEVISVAVESKGARQAVLRVIDALSKGEGVPEKEILSARSALDTLHRAVGDQSNLILDPDLDSYYLMEMTLVSTPKEQELIVQILHELSGLAQNPAGVRYSIAAKKGQLLDGLASQDRAVKVALENNKIRNIGVVESILIAKKSSIKAFLQLIENQKYSEAMLVGVEALNSSHVAWDVQSRELEAIIAHRVSSLESRRLIILSVVAVMGIGLLFFSGLLFRGIVKTAREASARLETLRSQDITALQESLQALAEEEKFERVTPKASVLPPLEEVSDDELGDLSRSLNQLQTQTVNTLSSYERSQDALKRAHKLLKASEQRFRTMIESLNEGILIVDSGDKILYSNGKMLEMSGIDEPLLGRDLSQILPKGDWEALKERLSRSGDRDCVSEEMPIYQPKGPVLWTSVQASHYQVDEQGDPSYLLALMDVTERREFEEQLRRQAFHDALTGLPNRALFMDRLNVATAKMQRTGIPFAVFFLDIDNFKVVNDSLGHEVGDLLLQRVACELQLCVRNFDTVARLGGDEFTILINDLSSSFQLEEMASRIELALQKPFKVLEQTIYTGASIGVAVADDRNLNSGDILRNADIAMYHAKSQGKGRCQVFDSAMQEAAKDRLEIENDLREALTLNQLNLVYQPIIDLQSEKIVEFEALIRWNHPTRGLVSPSKFVPIAEETGLIDKIGEWVLREACNWVITLDERAGKSLDFTVCVNLSTVQLRTAAIVEVVRKVLSETKINPARLKIEITESLMLENPDEAISRLTMLRDLGVRLAVDDFGTGYSSMGYLKQMPIDTLKIDRSFVMRAKEASEDEAIIRAIIQMADSMNLSVTGEGIETNEQLSLLRNLGCLRGQGFLFSHPLSAEDASDLMTRKLAKAA